ncbi:MAG TPA: hypothetical protein VGM82_24510 [Gemmatimonadaceae bacterium]|jgi:hypothetical protein
MSHRILLRALLALCALSVAAPVVAQTQVGVRISGTVLEHEVAAEYVEASGAPRDSLRLAVAVLWRGSPGWSGNQGPASSAKLEAVQADVQRRGVILGGTATATADAWIEYDPHTDSVTVLNHAYALPRGESTAVLLVDRVDHVGGDPIVSIVNIVCAHGTQVDLSSGLTQAAMQTMRETTQRWHSCLVGDPRVADFLSRPSSR